MAWEAGATAADAPPETSSAAAPVSHLRAAQAASGTAPTPSRPPPRRSPRRSNHHSPPQRGPRPPAPPPAPPLARRPRRPPLPPASGHAAAGPPAAPPRAPLPRSSGQVARSRLRQLPRSPPGCERPGTAGDAHSARLTHERPSRRAPVPCRHRARPSPCCSPRRAGRAAQHAPPRRRPPPTGDP